MGFPKEQPAPSKSADQAPPSSGQTTPQLGTANSAQQGAGAPSQETRLPHERDESSDSQNSNPREVMKQAHKDVEAGLVDTDRGPVVDDLYENQIRTEETPGRGPPSGDTKVSKRHEADETAENGVKEFQEKIDLQKHARPGQGPANKGSLG